MAAHGLSLAGDHAPAMERIELKSFADFLAHGHGLACWCPGCRRWAKCDLPKLVRNGLGDREPSRCLPRCRLCGSRGRWQVQGPMADVTPSGLAKAEPIPPADSVVPIGL